MDQTTLLDQIEKIIEKKLTPLQKQLTTLETDTASIKAKLSLLDVKIEIVNKKIDLSQQETIDALSAVIHTGYNLHEERITKIEKQLTSTQAQ